METIACPDLRSYCRRLQAGQVVAYNLEADGKAVELKAFINAPAIST